MHNLSTSGPQKLDLRLHLKRPWICEALSAQVSREPKEPDTRISALASRRTGQAFAMASATNRLRLSPRAIAFNTAFWWSSAPTRTTNFPL